MDVYGYSGSLRDGKLSYIAGEREILDWDDRACSFGTIHGAPAEVISGSAICLGDFDGLHRGHMRLFQIAGKYEKHGVLIFNRSSKNKPELTVLSEKLEILSEIGTDYAIVAEFSEEFAHGTPEEFVKFLAKRLRVAAVVAGYDYRFGYKAAADTAELVRLCTARGIDVKVAEAVVSEGSPIKSTAVRELVEKGELEHASRLLGRHYQVSGGVEKGFQNGRRMGFPTANIAYSPQKLLPPDGVYYGRICGRGAVINIGKNPTFGAEERTVEAHIPGYTGDLYGVRITAELIEKIRSEHKFKNQDELMEQIKKDIEWVKEREYEYGKENTNGNDL